MITIVAGKEINNFHCWCFCFPLINRGLAISIRGKLYFQEGRVLRALLSATIAAVLSYKFYSISVDCLRVEL